MWWSQISFAQEEERGLVQQSDNVARHSFRTHNDDIQPILYSIGVFFGTSRMPLKFEQGMIRCTPAQAKAIC